MTIQNRLSEIWYTRCGVPTPVGLAARWRPCAAFDVRAAS
jgi:hypothetical protein